MRGLPGAAYVALAGRRRRIPGASPRRRRYRYARI